MMLGNASRLPVPRDQAVVVHVGDNQVDMFAAFDVGNLDIAIFLNEPVVNANQSKGSCICSANSGGRYLRSMSDSRRRVD